MRSRLSGPSLTTVPSSKVTVAVSPTPVENSLTASERSSLVVSQATDAPTPTSSTAAAAETTRQLILEDRERKGRMLINDRIPARSTSWPAWGIGADPSGGRTRFKRDQRRTV